MQILGTAPMLYLISASIYFMTGMNPVWIFKVMGPILYGTLILAVYRFLRISIRWPEPQSFAGAALCSLYFVTLRISWDMYRSLLGLTFILLSLPLLGTKTFRQNLILAFLVVFAVAADQLTGFIGLALVGGVATAALLRRDFDDFRRKVGLAMPGGLLFVAIAYAGEIAPGGGLVQAQAMLPSGTILVSSVGFLVYLYWILFPLAIFGYAKVHNTALRNWSLVCVTASLTVLIPLYGPIVPSYRWSLLLDLPICVYATAGLWRIRDSVVVRGLQFVQLSRTALPLAFCLLATSAVLYITLPAQQALPLYAAFPNFFPTSMIQDTVPFSDMASLSHLLNWSVENIGPSTALITHQAIYGWVRAYSPSSLNFVVNYGYSTPLEGLRLATLAGYRSVIMIWWVNGLGWHGQPFIPPGFVVLVTSGNMAVYAYQQSLQGANQLLENGKPS